MDRRQFLIGGVGALGVAQMAAAQQGRKIPRIGFLWTSAIEPKYLEAFRGGLREHGYIEGRNISLEHRSAANAPQRLDGLASELLRRDIDVVVTQGTPAAQAAAKATTSIPVVIALGEPVGGRLVASLSHPSRNVTGLTVLSTELNAKRLELLRELNPKVARLAMIFDVTRVGPDGTQLLGPTQAVARSYGLHLDLMGVRSASDFEQAFAAAVSARAEGILIGPSPVLSFHNKPLVELAAAHRLPAIYGNPEAVQLGGLMSYGPRYTELFRRAATYVDKILKGARPADLPVEQPTKFDLVINVRTARALGVAIPPSLLLRADQVIE